MHPRTVARMVVRLVAHSTGYVYGLLAPVRLTPGERRFVDANRALWREMGSATDPVGDILVEPMFHPVIMHGNASFAAIVARSERLRPLFTLHSHADRRTKALLASYPGARFVHIHSPRAVPAWIGAWVRALRAYRQLRHPRDILELSEDGYRYGDIIYDALLARGYASVRSVDLWTLVTLQRYFFYRSSIARILREHRVRAYVSSQSYIGLLMGTFTRAVLRERVLVLARIGAASLFVRRYRGPEGIWQYPLRPEPHVFEALVEDPTGEARRHADRYIEERLAQATQDPSANLAFDRRRRLYLDRDSFAAEHSLDPAKPIVFVMLHAFNDYPHSHFRRPLMFQDYYEWFIATLQRARAITSVNWVVKEHPGAAYYPTKDLDLGAVMGAVAEPHIRFLSHDSDLNAASLRYIAHAIVTCVGTAGLEYSCFGIPCVVAGESPYSGYGFTREPSDREAYVRELDQIASIGRLSGDQVRIARLVAWYELGLVYDLPYLLGLPYAYWQIADFKKFDVWNDAATIVASTDRLALRRQMGAISRFLKSEGSEQLLNVEKYGFLRSAIGLPDEAA